MKFIRLLDGSYINAGKVLKFFIQRLPFGKVCVYAKLGIEDSAAIHSANSE